MQLTDLDKVPILTTSVDERTLDLFSRCAEPEDHIQLRNLYLGRVECELNSDLRPELKRLWQNSKRLRTVESTEIMNSPTTVRYIKELFNFFFRDDLYGSLRTDSNAILSSGASCESTFPLPKVLKDCISKALKNDWYGYSDSRGRRPSRAAVAALERERFPQSKVDESNVCIALGGTWAVSAVFEHLFGGRGRGPDDEVIIAVPNYPPLVSSASRYLRPHLVQTSLVDGLIDLEAVINSLSSGTKAVLLQSVSNPLGVAVSAIQLQRLVEKAAAVGAYVVLDEAHHCLGPIAHTGSFLTNTNVVTIRSLSKELGIPGMKIGWIVASSQFISEFYEFASTTYGGPPSVFYLLIEVMARFEAWRLRGLDFISAVNASVISSEYYGSLLELNHAYRQFCKESAHRIAALIKQRDSVAALFRASGRLQTFPTHSVNIALKADEADSYVGFRRRLLQSGVATFPGVLTFCFDYPLYRISPCQNGSIVRPAIDRLIARNERF